MASRLYRVHLLRVLDAEASSFLLQLEDGDQDSVNASVIVDGILQSIDIGNDLSWQEAVPPADEEWVADVTLSPTDEELIDPSERVFTRDDISDGFWKL